MAMTACGPAGSAPGDTSTVTVFAAASLTDVFEAIGEVYEQNHPGSEVVFNFGASPALRTQLGEGAVADVAAFAGENDMQSLGEAGLVDPEMAQIFAENDLVVVVFPESIDKVTSLEDLGVPGVKVLMAAEGAPAGDYARQVLENLTAELGAGYRERVLANVVSEEDNVRQVLAKVQLGEADAGWVYRSDAHAAPELRVIEIPGKANVRAKYPIASLNGAAHPEAARDFMALVLSPEGQRLIEAGGFLPFAP
jgi:molybdate transport system substrate-binding protein